MRASPPCERIIMHAKGLFLGQFQAAVLAANAKVYSAAEIGCDVITGIQVQKVAGSTDFDLDVQVSCDGVVWSRFALITEASTVLAISFGLGFPFFKIAITETADDMNVKIWASGLKF